MEFYNHTVAKVEDLIPYALNSRTHSDEQVAQLAASIREFGFTNPVLIDEKNNLIAGHGRLLAARKLKLEQVPAVVVTGLDDRKRRALVIADNKLALNAGWDEEALRVELEDLAGDFSELMGFTDEELAKLLKGDDQTEGLTDEDAVPEVPEVPVTREGDVWILGRHRLMCGDSTSIDAVERLMDGRKSNMVFTDPPYLMDFTGAINNDGSKSHSAVHGAIKNDKMSREDGDKFIGDIVSNIKIFNDGAYYICFYRLGMDYVLRALDANQLKYRAMIVWYKKGGTLSNSDYKSNYEPIFYGWVNEHKFYGGKAEWDFWDISKTAKNDLHPTMKPVELFEYQMLNNTKGSDLVLDSFGGSGTTVIACEKHSRNARLMELDPKYCDVIIKRWQDFTGAQATLEETGQTYDELKAEREAA